MREALSDIDIELEQKENKILLLEDKIGMPDSRVIEAMNRLDFNKVSSKRTNDGIMNRLNKKLNNHKYIKKK